MLGFKRFKTVAVTIEAIELLLRIRKDQSNLARLPLRGGVKVGFGAVGG